MIDATEEELCACLSQLSAEQQRQVLEFARALAAPRISGVRGATLLRFSGMIDEADHQAISHAIADGCERVDADEW
jgi:hypothetical protein